MINEFSKKIENLEYISTKLYSKTKENNQELIPQDFDLNKYNEKVLERDLIKYKETSVQEVQAIIDKDIRNAYNNAKIIAEQYGSLYERDLSSDIYKVEKATTFFLTQEGYVYVVYAYGNNDYTNEMDVIIF